MRTASWNFLSGHARVLPYLAHAIVSGLAGAGGATRGSWARQTRDRTWRVGKLNPRMEQIWIDFS